MREPVELLGIENLDVPAGHSDDPVILQSREAAADRLQCKTEKSGDILPGHGKLELRPRAAELAESLAQALQEQRDAPVSLAPDQHLDVILIAPGALANDAQEKLLQQRKPRGVDAQFGKRYLTDTGAAQSDGFDAVTAAGQRVQTHQFPLQVEGEHLFLAVVRNRNSLQSALADDEYGVERLAGPEEPLCPFQHAMTADQTLQAVRPDAGMSTQLPQRTARTGRAKLCYVE